MNRSWITALTLASVVGTGGVFAGVVVASRDTPVAALPPSATQVATLVEPTTPTLAATGTIAYRVGDVGTVTLAVADSSLSLTGAVANAGWTTAGTGGSAAHVEAQFTDDIQLVTFSADLVGTSVVVSVTNVAVPAASTATGSLPAATHNTPSPAAPAPTIPQPQPTATNPAPARAYDDGQEADDGQEDHETEANDD